MSRNILKGLAREALWAGRLPDRRPNWLWGGPAQGAECSVCGKSLSHGETAFEAEFDHLAELNGHLADKVVQQQVAEPV